MASTGGTARTISTTSPTCRCPPRLDDVSAGCTRACRPSTCMTEHTVWSARASRGSASGCGRCAVRRTAHRVVLDATVGRPRYRGPTTACCRSRAGPARRDHRGRRAGAAQGAARRGGGPGRVAGAGPLLLVVADALLRSGVEVVVVAESGHPTKYGLHPQLAGRGSRSREAAAYAAPWRGTGSPTCAGWRDPRRPRVRPGRGVTLATPTRSHHGTSTWTRCSSRHGFTPALELLLQADSGDPGRRRRLGRGRRRRPAAHVRRRAARHGGGHRRGRRVARDPRGLRRRTGARPHRPVRRRGRCAGSPVHRRFARVDARGARAAHRLGARPARRRARLPVRGGAGRRRREAVAELGA